MHNVVAKSRLAVPISHKHLITWNRTRPGEWRDCIVSWDGHIVTCPANVGGRHRRGDTFAVVRLDIQLTKRSLMGGIVGTRVEFFGHGSAPGLAPTGRQHHK